MMSILYKRQHKKKEKFPRVNHRNYHITNRIKLKRRIYKKRGWKLNYPDLFEEIEKFPYIIKKVQKD